ncbi:MAG: ATP-dependent DNA helicase [Planctomycetota bacterium]
MTDHLDVDAVFGDGGAISRRLVDYEPRPQQLDLAHAVERALRDGRHLLAEAGTGVGKSFAYLVPAVLHALAHPERGPVVVSTRTIALQEQLEQKDLPFLHAVLPLEWSSITAVGRSHYVCLRRLHHAVRDRGALFTDRTHDGQLDRVMAWALRSHGGLRFEIAEPVDDSVWEEVNAEAGNCLYKACPHYDACPYQRARRRLETAQVIVVNHSLYCADIALRMAGARYLPDHGTVIFDEAHHLERVATDQLGLRITKGAMHWQLRRLRARRKRRSAIDPEVWRVLGLRIEETAACADALFAELDARLHRRSTGTLALEPDDVLDDPLTPALFELSAELQRSLLGVEDIDLRTELGARAKSLVTLASVLGSLRGPCDRDTVRWVESGPRGAILRSAPLSVGDALSKHVFAAPRNAILVSATLAPGATDDLSWFGAQLGVRERFDSLRAGSPFDFARNMRVRLATAMPDPTTAADAFQRRCCEVVRDAVLQRGGRALVLCTSWSFVRAIAEELRTPLEDAGIPLLVQSKAPMRELLQRKRNEPTSVLVGADTLWEGIDVPGDALTLVIVTRLPFSPPDHPLTRARMKAIEARGGDPFREASLPEAVLRFRQGIGRLIRRADDKGEVLILDPRVRTKPYGRAFLGALPEGVEITAAEEFDSRSNSWE